MKALLTIVVLALCIIVFQGTSFSQTTFEYVYDAAGNRTNRNVLTLKSATINNTNDSIKNEGSNGDIERKARNKGSDFLGDMTLLLYPIPTLGKIELEIDNFSKESSSEILVFDIKGILLFRNTRIAQKTSIDLSNQPQGTYIVKIVLNGEVSEWKIIKE